MSFFDKVKASVGKDSAELEVDMQARPSKRGEVLRALIHIKPGKNNQKMRYLRVSLEYTGHFQVPSRDNVWVNVEGTGRIWYGDWPNTTDIVIEPGKTYQYPVELRVPSDSPVSSDKLKYKFFVRADIDDAKDPEFATHFDVKE